MQVTFPHVLTDTSSVAMLSKIVSKCRGVVCVNLMVIVAVE